MNRRSPSLLLCGLVLFLVPLTGQLTSATQTDIYCLESIQKSFTKLANLWDFSNQTEGFICSFVGIDCWHPNENRVLNINLQDMGLKGQFPLNIINCTSLTGLDLSGNKLDGPIPSKISKLLPFVTLLDLSKNRFSGPIPTDLSNCVFLNSLLLDNNRLSGHIPPQLHKLARLKQFSVASNNLTGRIPSFSVDFPVAGYAHNPGLCGSPLTPC